MGKSKNYCKRVVKNLLRNIGKNMEIIRNRVIYDGKEVKESDVNFFIKFKKFFLLLE